MTEIVTVALVLAGLLGFELAALRWGADSRQLDPDCPARQL
jgi:hypothetical protein